MNHIMNRWIIPWESVANHAITFKKAGVAEIRLRHQDHQGSWPRQQWIAKALHFRAWSGCPGFDDDSSDAAVGIAEGMG